MNYPYLGIKTVEDRKNIVFFTGENKGVVVYDETHKGGMEFGRNAAFDEDEYDFLSDKDDNGNEIFVRLSN